MWLQAQAPAQSYNPAALRGPNSGSIGQPLPQAAQPQATQVRTRTPQDSQHSHPSIRILAEKNVTPSSLLPVSRRPSLSRP